MDLSVIIVNYNTRLQTLECLASVAATAPAGTEVVVVDNGSTDGSAQTFREQHPQVIVDEAGENLGFARGVNRGVAASRGEYIVLLNPDTIALPGSLARLLAFARAHPSHGVYGGRTLSPSGHVDPSSCWGAPSVWSLTCFATGLSTLFRRTRMFDPESLGSWERDSVREVPIVTGCLLLMRRKDWDELGGMDERYFLYGEDAEFSLRARRHGWRPVIVPDAVIVHETGGSSDSHGRKMSMIMAGKATLLRTSWGPVRSRIGLVLLAGGAGLRAALGGLRGRRGMWWTVWARRGDWLPGYPAAYEPLFGPART